MRIELAYGDGVHHVMTPAGVSVRYLEPKDITALDDVAAALGRALTSPEGSEPLASRLAPRSSVLIVVTDPTRGGAGAMLPALVDTLLRMGVGATRMRVLVARGTHRSLTQEEKRFLRSESMHGVSVEEHDCDDATRLSALTLTRRGTPVRINRAVRAADLVILLSPVSFHYFAGFGGGRKLVLPGCADRASILANHKLSLVEDDPVALHPACQPGNLDGNPVHEDMCEVLSALDHLFGVNYFTDVAGRIVFVNAGDPIASHIQACEAYYPFNSVAMERPARVVVASAGGAPYDINLLQSHKALYHACRAAAPNASVLLVAACPEGVGSESLSAALAQGRKKFLPRALRDYVLNSQTAVSLLGLTRRHRVGMVTELDAETMARAGVSPVENAEAFLAEALEEHGVEDVTVIRSASRTLPVIQGSTES